MVFVVSLLILASFSRPQLHFFKSKKTAIKMECIDITLFAVTISIPFFSPMHRLISSLEWRQVISHQNVKFRHKKNIEFLDGSRNYDISVHI